MALAPNLAPARKQFRKPIRSMDPRLTTARILRAWFWLGMGFALLGTVWALVPHEQTLVPPSRLLEWLRDQSELLRIILANDKTDHAVGFAMLMGWFCQLYESGPRRARVMVALLVLAAAIEIMQGFTAWRTAELGDWFAGAVGIGIGWAASSPRTPNVLRWLLPRPA
jgi:VanZ family protein